jgi:hypothetical protein
VTDQESLEWKIKTLCNAAIAHNWAVLTTEGLSSEQRKATRENLQTKIKNLRQIVGQRPSVSEAANLEANTLYIHAV